jgi:16S rRNA processing protein RimM
MPPRLAPTGRSSSRSSKRSEPAAPATDGVVAVGEIVAAHALRGLLRVRAYQPPAPSLAPGRQVVLEHGDTRRRVTVVSAAPHARGLVLVALDGVTDRDAAEALVGARLLVRADELPPPAADEFYYHEVVGFRVETTDGRCLGTVDATFSTGVNDVLVVRDGEREHLIPVIADVVRAIERGPRRIVIEPMPGLLE